MIDYTGSLHLVLEEISLFPHRLIAKLKSFTSDHCSDVVVWLFSERKCPLDHIMLASSKLHLSLASFSKFSHVIF